MLILKMIPLGSRGSSGSSPYGSSTFGGPTSFRHGISRPYKMGIWRVERWPIVAGGGVGTVERPCHEGAFLFFSLFDEGGILG